MNHFDTLYAKLERQREEERAATKESKRKRTNARQNKRYHAKKKREREEGKKRYEKLKEGIINND